MYPPALPRSGTRGRDRLLLNNISESLWRRSGGRWPPPICPGRSRRSSSWCCCSLACSSRWAGERRPARCSSHGSQAAIVPNGAAEVIDVPVAPNTSLKAGDVLFRIDAVPYCRAIARARGPAHFAETRLAQIWGGGSVLHRRAGRNSRRLLNHSRKVLNTPRQPACAAPASFWVGFIRVEIREYLCRFARPSESRLRLSAPFPAISRESHPNGYHGTSNGYSKMRYESVTTFARQEYGETHRTLQHVTAERDLGQVCKCVIINQISQVK